ncbi:chromatin modification- protein VID21 [Penicillium rubens]|uniref:uncharacterized protein n=1 Tax=Penicillium rubens TaxID=1108849 RepID=UPI001DCEB9DF|nr:uncharacterized protein N7525_004461 [Penicillium rubens]KAF3029339.1 chromatin modification- protein VID21 [Penicillium rubens]KAJ5044757.1 RNA polymerase II transcription elongation factor SpEAF [Penicillium rubens]KAJ5839273.1 hypothetical protein N7525_004461 [Penicillium rubens]
MLRDELLRSKNDEIANCLSRRKRKLSALYLATVGFGATEDAHYHQKEQAFLDANDLSKGRYFNEATLPPPTHARARSPSRNAIPPTTAATTSTKAVAGITSPSTVDGGAPHATEPQQHGTPILDQPQTATSHLPPTPVDTTGTRRPSVPATSPRLPRDLDVPPIAVQSLDSSRAEQKASVPVAETSLSAHDNDATISPRVSKPTATGVPSLEIPSDSLRKKHEARPSVTLGPSQHEQPPSPASSIDPYNNNTPVPVAASPDTSPAEEVTEEVGAIDRPKHKHDRSAHPRPSLVPLTPDEQLRLEEAQSKPDKPVNDVVADIPSSKEVIVESVDTGVDTDRMDVDQEPEPVPSEAKAPQEPQTTVQDSLSPTAQAEVAVDSTVETPTAKKLSIPPTQPGSAQPERMTTRVSSGAIRHKSVSEILGETPKSVTHDRSHPVTPSDQGSPDSVARMRFKDRKEREKERSRLSTVVFPKQPAQQEKADSTDLTHRDMDAVAKLNEEQDYLFTLFLNRAYAPPRGTNLNTLLASAHKTLSTSNHLLEYQEQMDCRTLRRIYALQNANRWPLRQLKRSVEPPRQGTHWDVVLDHMKWMRTDFREERKWKIAAAKSCADWCAEYVNSDVEHRTLLRVQAKIPTATVTEKDSSKAVLSPPSDDVGDEVFGVSHPTPDLMPSAEEESVSDGFNDEPRHDIHDAVAPAAIFSLGSDEFNFSIDMTPAAEKLLDELPIYGPLQIAPGTNAPAFKVSPDTVWKTELLPVSKFASAKITFHDDDHPRKRSRYDYSQYGNDSDNRITELAPEQTNVALFRPENKPIRDRIHPGHQFRPPTEHPMPSVGFFESRSSSQWTFAEDDELRRLVKEYSYNWSLISSCLTPPSLFTSGAERRTPWECFERWVGLEGLPADMSKTQYFRAYHQRLETAQRTVLAQQQAAQQQQQQQQQQQGANAQPQPPVRRRTTQPLRVDRRRSSKHLALLDAMRKLAKKRETMLQKQQHASHLASLRKANEANQPKPPISSPAEFSRLKYDREMKLQERQEQYRQQMIAQQRASLAAQRSGQVPNQQQMMNAPGRNNTMPPTSNPSLPGGTPNGMTNGIPPSAGVNQARPIPMQNMPNGAQPNGQMPNGMAMKMMPQAQLQQTPGARPGLPMQASPDNTRVIREANRLQEQQRLLQSRQQQQHPQQGQQFHNPQFGSQGSPNMNMSNVNGTPNNPAMMAALQNQGGMQSPSFHGGTPQGVSTPSPRMGQPNPLSSGVVPQISTLQSQIQRTNPNMPPEQVTKLATDRLNQYQQQQQQRLSQQAAMNAAAGSINANAVQASYQVPHEANFQAPNGGSGMQVPQNQGFSPMMRVPQPGQQNRVGPTSSPAMNGAAPLPSRSATPQNQRSGSAQAGAVQGSSKSPHAPAAQTATS